MTPDLVVQHIKCRGMWQLQVQGGEGGRDVSSPQATGVHSIDNCLVYDEQCRTSTVATRAVQILSSTSRSSC